MNSKFNSSIRDDSSNSEASSGFASSIAGVLGATQVDDGPRGLTGSPGATAHLGSPPRGQASGDHSGVYPDSQAILCGNATKKKTGM